MKSLALASKVKPLALASMRTNPRKYPRPRTALLFDLLKISQGHELIFSLSEISRKFCKLRFYARRHFFLDSTCALCPWSLNLASRIPALGDEWVCPWKVGRWPWYCRVVSRAGLFGSGSGRVRA